MIAEIQTSKSGGSSANLILGLALLGIVAFGVYQFVYVPYTERNKKNEQTN